METRLRYTMSLSDKQILERTAPSVYFQFPGFATLGTNEMLGNDFTKTSWYNMGEIISNYRENQNSVLS